VWLAFVLMLTIFHHPKAKNVLFGDLSYEKKRMLGTSLTSFFSLKESSPNKKHFP
jgi:hypothetical protein